jgi:hypothetical protein
MSNTGAFPTLPAPSLSLDRVIAYLLSLKNDGHAIYRDAGRPNVFFIGFGELKRIRISVGAEGGKAQVQLLHCENVTSFLDVSTITQLEETVSSFARKATGGQWPVSPSTGRLQSTTPATNYATISQLIGSSRIEAVFDPYLENRSLATLVDILSFGGGEVAEGVRLLGSSRTTQGSVARFTRAGVDAWLSQLGIPGEARVMPPSEHRRFILLSGGRSLLLGHSLNAIHKNEAIRVEPDPEDRSFFDSVWATATILA